MYWYIDTKYYDILKIIKDSLNIWVFHFLIKDKDEKKNNILISHRNVNTQSHSNYN